MFLVVILEQKWASQHRDLQLKREIAKPISILPLFSAWPIRLFLEVEWWYRSWRSQLQSKNKSSNKSLLLLSNMYFIYTPLLSNRLLVVEARRELCGLPYTLHSFRTAVKWANYWLLIVMSVFFATLDIWRKISRNLDTWTEW